MSVLAINGGLPVRQGLLPAQVTIGQEEKEAANNVLDSKLLSGFRGNSTRAFYGGEKINEFEELFKKYLKTLYAYSCNSATSALQLSCAAAGIEPGDEVIVTPWSMSCSATAPMIFGGIPVFADIERDYFCLDPKSVEDKITKKTKAIIVVDLFGQPYDPQINHIANKYGLTVIEDAAQAIGSQYGMRPAGTIGNIGCFSFTQGKHLTAGEGGMIVSNDSKLARNFSLLRNHAEAVISDMNTDMLHENNLVGFNMRMTEIQAAILIEQLKKLQSMIHRRQTNAFELAKGLNEIPFIQSAPVREKCTHSFYVQAFFYDQEKANGIHRDKFIAAVKAELQPEEGRIDKGVPIGCGYIKPLYRMPLFQHGEKKNWVIRDKSYFMTNCSENYPVVEKLWKDDLFLHTMCGMGLQEQDRQDIINAFYKVSENLEELK